MRKQWLRWGRVLWVLLALNGVVLVGSSLWKSVELLRTPSPRIVQGLAQAGLSLEFYGTLLSVPIVLMFVTFFVVALLIFIRRPNDGFALFTAVFLLNFGASTAYPSFPEFYGFYYQPPFWYFISYLLAGFASWPLLIAFLFVYPDGKFAPRWLWLVSLFGVLTTSAWILFPTAFADPSSPLGLFGAAFAILLSSATLYGQVWRYRHHASPIERQQTKWFVYALLIFVTITIISFAAPYVTGQNTTSATAGTSVWGDVGATMSTLGNSVIPIAIGIAILRYRLWDIDVLIRRTLTYAILSAFLALIYFGSIVALQRIVSILTGVDQNEIVTVVSTLGIAALFVPLRNWIQAIIDQRFYRKKYDAQKVLSAFAETVRDETDLNQLSARLMQVVQETMQPKSVSVWLNEQDNASK